MIKHFNNKTQKVGDDLKTTLEKGSKISIAAAIFSIYGFESLKKELKKGLMQQLLTGKVRVKA
jgi:hypothetical protein